MEAMGAQDYAFLSLAQQLLFDSTQHRRVLGQNAALRVARGP